MPTRGQLAAGALTLALAGAAVGSTFLVGSRSEARVHTTQVIIKEVERDLVRDRMERGDYPRVLHPEPLDGWGRPIKLEVPGNGGKPYRLVSFGADGEPGGTGKDADISNWEF